MQINFKKKYIVIPIIIIVCLIAFVAILNFYLFYRDLSSNTSIYGVINNYISFMSRDISEKNTYNNLIVSNSFPSVENENSEKGGILLFGYSFADISEQNKEETLSYKLGEQTQRPVYNRTRDGWGVQHMLYQLSNEDFYKIVPKPEYIIYVYYDGNLANLYSPITPTDKNTYGVFYKKTKKGFILKKRTFFSDKIIVQHYLRNYLNWNIWNKFKLYSLWQENLFADYIVASKDIAEKHWGKDIKFAILCYSPLTDAEVYKKFEINDINIIDKEDFKIDINDKQFHVSDTYDNPNEKAWDAIVPIIIKKLEM